jgi:NAD-dependent deacetylase
MHSRVPDLIAARRRTVVLTGAGVSQESGVPTFRGAGGLWEGDRPEDLATPEAFRRDPQKVWRWYGSRREVVAGCRPNRAHEAIAALEERMPEFALITQNVDGLHRLAGSRRMIELHGCLWLTRCTVEGTVREDRRVPLPETPPRCGCGALLRPHVVWFGEELDAGDLDAAFAAARRAELFLSVGTSAIVHPAAMLPGVAARAGAWVVEVNPEETGISAWVDERHRGPAARVLPGLLAP